jgi:MFS family permease
MGAAFGKLLLLPDSMPLSPSSLAKTFHWSSEGAGLVMLAIVIPSVVSPIVGHFSDMHGPKWWAVAGYVLSTPPLFLLRLVKHDTTSQKILSTVLLALIGGFNIFLEIPLWVEVVARIEEKAKAQAKANPADDTESTSLGNQWSSEWNHNIILRIRSAGRADLVWIFV